MRRSLLVCLTLAAAALTGCTAEIHLYPVKGPLVATTPPPVLNAKLTAHPPRSLSVMLALADGEKVTGSLYVTLPTPKEPLPPTVPLAMTTDWDAVYGHGTYVAHVLGQGQDARGKLIGEHGTTVNMEIHYTPGGPPLIGVAEDNKGNIYKVTVDRG